MKSNHEQSVFAAINSATGQEVKLALQELWLTGRVLPVGAALQVRHVFQCAEEKPVEVVYAFGLPRDAALRRFRIVGNGFSVMSELKPTAEADYGEAELLAKAQAVSVGGLAEAGLLKAKDGKVRLWRAEELAKDWDPASDERLTVWEMTHHLLRVYYHEKAGDAATGELLRRDVSGRARVADALTGRGGACYGLRRFSMENR